MDDRSKLADALAARDRLYRELFEEDTSARFIATPEWRVLDCNAMLAAMLGYDDRSKVVGRSLLEMAPDRSVLQKLLAVTRVERRAGPAELQFERADAQLIDVSCSLAASIDESGALVALRGQVTEITERRRLETRLLGAERMEMVGRLAGGMAHDFNNLLTVISGNSERLLESMRDQDPLKGAVSAIHDASARAASMTRQLLAYSRRQVFALQPLSLQRLVADVQPLVAEILGDHIQVRTFVLPDVPEINADPRQIEHVLANLAHNAREAMPSGGALTIRVDAIDIGEHAPRERLWLRSGRYVRLLVSDNGHGMDPVTKSYAFQPFFTTKRMGNGRGLGLATVYGIVKQSNGFVWVDSEQGRGTTFTLLFPALNSDSIETASSQARSGTETILVVEERASFRDFIRAALERRGHRVLSAGSGAEALAMFASHPSRIHLVLAHVGAVTEDGVPLVTRLKTLDPRIQSLVMLAPEHAGAGVQSALPTTPAIQQPFTLQALARKVRSVLDSGEGRG